MSLSTLLEAAQFLERQEQEQQRAVAAQLLDSTLASTPDSDHEAAGHKTQTAQQLLATHPSLIGHILAPRITPALTTPINHTTTSTTAIITTNTANHATAESSSTVILLNPPHNHRQHISSSAAPSVQNGNCTAKFHNSFDIVNVGNVGIKQRPKQPPFVFRAGIREVHNKLEKHRRAHLKECFDALKRQLPHVQDEKKASNLAILHAALKCIQQLKRRERDLEQEMEHLARDKIAAQQRLAVLKKDCDYLELTKCMSPILALSAAPKSVAAATATASVTGPIFSTALNEAIPLLPVGYPVNQGIVLQKLIVPTRGGGEVALTATPIVGGATAQFVHQPINGGKLTPATASYMMMKLTTAKPTNLGTADTPPTTDSPSPLAAVVDSALDTPTSSSSSSDDTSSPTDTPPTTPPYSS